jgi:hypothetical protein
MSESQAFAELLRRFPPEVAAIARQLRELVFAADSSAIEVVWLQQGIAGYGVGPKKMTEHYVYIAPQGAHVNFGFYRGAVLDDSERLLEGTGKALRHVKIRASVEVNRPGLRSLLEAAIAERRLSLGHPPGGARS